MCATYLWNEHIYVASVICQCPRSKQQICMAWPKHLSSGAHQWIPLRQVCCAPPTAPNPPQPCSNLVLCGVHSRNA